ncbi:permease [Lacrimispora sp. 38-1]|uniref:permease n=1 Tax=Lacrimispora sp. 38-1 TaxID=3125778 RepID=UPI003CED822D
MDIFTALFWIVTLVWFFVSIAKDRKKTFGALKMSGGMMKGMAGEILAILFLIGLIMTFVPQDTVRHFMGKSNLLISTIIFALIGCITLIPAFVAFPLAGSLLDAGANLVPVVAFLTTLTMVGIVTFPLEKREFGLKFTLLRNSLSFVFAILIAVIMGVIL